MNINQLSWALLHTRPYPRSLERLNSALLKSKVVSSLFLLLSPLMMLNGTVSWSLQPRRLLTFTSPISPSLSVSLRPSKAPLLVHSSITWVRKLSSMHSWIAYALLCRPSTRGLAEVPCEDKGLQIGKCSYLQCIGPHPLVPPGQAACSRHPPQCNAYVSSLKSLPISSQLSHHPSPG